MLECRQQQRIMLAGGGGGAFVTPMSSSMNGVRQWNNKYKHTKIGSSPSPSSSPRMIIRQLPATSLSSSSLPDNNELLSSTMDSILDVASDAGILAIDPTTTNLNTMVEPVIFEPVLNVPALVSSFVILLGALLLRVRQSSIATAAQRRIVALEQLRDYKKKELTQNASTEEVQLAIQEYKTSLQEEEKLRTILPGIQLRAPNNPARSEQDRQAVRQFLGGGERASSSSDDNDNDNNDVMAQPQPSTNNSIARQPGVQNLSSSSSKINNDNTNHNNDDDDEISKIGPILGVVALLALLASPQFLTIFINEHDTLEILDILSD